MVKNDHPASGIIAQFGKHVLPWVGDDPNRAATVRCALQDVVAGKYPGSGIAASAPVRYYPQRDFGRYDRFLHPLNKQLELLWKLIPKLPEALRVDPSWLDVDTVSDHAQSVEDLEFFFIVLDTLERTIVLNWELMKLTQPAVYHSGFETDAANLRLGPNTRWYEPGLYRVRINLVDNWDPKQGRSIDQVRTRVASTGALLASIEPIGAYAIHPELLQQQDGENLPYCDLAGLQQGRGFAQVPGFHWDGIDSEAYLYSWESGFADRSYAAPSLQGVQN